MKKSIFTKWIVFLLVFVFSTSGYVYSADSLQLENAQSLVKLKVMQGYPDGSLKLDNKIKRSEFITLVVKMLGYDRNADTNSTKIPYTDIENSHWAYEYIKSALKYRLVSGYPNNTIAPDRNVTYAEALTVLVRALGYENQLTGKWPDNVLNMSSQLSLDVNLKLEPGRQLTRGEVAVLVFNSLTVELDGM